MQQYNMLQAIYMSFYSKDLYRDVAKNWNGKTFLYLLMLLALSWIFATFQFQVAINKGYQELANKYIHQIPVLTVKDGKISTPENRPYFIIDPDTNENIAIIDTSGKYTSLDQTKTDLLITEMKVITHQKENEVRIYDVPKNTNIALEPSYVNEKLSHYVGFTWILMFIFFLFCAYIYRIIQGFLYSVIGLIFNSINKTDLTYGQIMQIMMVAFTPVIIITTIWDALSIQFPLQLFSYFIIAMIYLFFGIAANKN